MSKTFIARPMNQVSQFNYQVDIVVPYYGQYEKVTQLLESIFRLTRSNYYKVYVIDDYSPNGKYIQNIEFNAKKNANRSNQENLINTFRNEKQLGYAGACKVGYNLGESPYVCFINSDCLIKDTGWLKSMGESLINLKSQGVRMIAPMTDNIVGGDESQKGECFERNSEDVILDRDSHLSLYCFMCHRQLFNKVGGFLKEYPLGGYEDQEFAHRLHKFGFKQGVCRGSWVQHEGEQTFREILRRDPNGSRVILSQNREKCIEDIKSLNKK